MPMLSAVDIRSKKIEQYQLFVIIWIMVTLLVYISLRRFDPSVNNIIQVLSSIII